MPRPERVPRPGGRSGRRVGPARPAKPLLAPGLPGGAAASPDLSRWRDDLAALGLNADARQLDALGRFVSLLQRWSATYNLTAVRDPAAIWVQHVLDSLAALPPVARWLSSRYGSPVPIEPPSGLGRSSGPALEALLRSGAQSAPPRVLDVGSGGGLPGVVWALFMPDADVHCVDAVGKKAAFVRQVAAELPLPNLHAHHERVESMRGAGFDLIACRAFASLADFTRLSRHLLAPQAAWVALKGKLPQAEIDALPAVVRVFHVKPLQVPGLAAERCLVWMRPVADEPASAA